MIEAITAFNGPPPQDISLLSLAVVLTGMCTQQN